MAFVLYLAGHTPRNNLFSDLRERLRLLTVTSSIRFGSLGLGTLMSNRKEMPLFASSNLLVGRLFVDGHWAMAIVLAAVLFLMKCKRSDPLL